MTVESLFSDNSANILSSAAEEVFSTVLSLELENMADSNREWIVTSYVTLTDISGHSSYMLLMDCESMLLDVIAEGIFDQSVDDLEIEDMLNAMTEMTNLIGGQLITVLNKNYHLGIPSVFYTTETEIEVSPEDEISVIAVGVYNSALRLRLSRL